MVYSAIFVLLFRAVTSASDCNQPPMALLSDNPKKTCTEISASANTLVYSCTSLIKGFTKSKIKYCPVEQCRDNGTWTKPSISCALSECYVDGSSREYRGYRTCTESGRPCQRWDQQTPNTHRFKADELFSDDSIHVAEAYCRDPDGAKGFPWCVANDDKKPKWEKCDVKKCSDLEIQDLFCGSPKPSASEENNNPVSSAPTIDMGTVSTGTTETTTITAEATAATTTTTEAEATTTTTETTTTEVVPEVTSGSCGEGHRYRMSKGAVPKAKNYTVVGARTAIECAERCSVTSQCHVFSYSDRDRLCKLYDDRVGRNDKEVPTRRDELYKTGTKIC